MTKFKTLFEKTTPFYVIELKSKLKGPEIRDLKKAGEFEIDGNTIETTDKKVYNRLLDKLDEIGLEYTNFVELLKENKFKETEELSDLNEGVYELSVIGEVKDFKAVIEMNKKRI
jgi:hypothetical protein